MGFLRSLGRAWVAAILILAAIYAIGDISRNGRDIRLDPYLFWLVVAAPGGVLVWLAERRIDAKNERRDR
jgi:hypothetical protein